MTDRAEAKVDNVESEGQPSKSTFKIGQKFPTPSPGNGDRVFYETLYRQKPESEMAQDWCVAYGVLEPDEAAIAYKKILQRKGGKVTASPAKGKAPRQLAESSKSRSTNRRSSRVNDDDDDEFDDTGIGE